MASPATPRSRAPRRRPRGAPGHGEPRPRVEVPRPSPASNVSLSLGLTREKEMTILGIFPQKLRKSQKDRHRDEAMPNIGIGIFSRLVRPALKHRPENRSLAGSVGRTRPGRGWRDLSRGSPTSG
eukprot:8154184-Pyramimonas_sp.AAC.1